MCTYQPEPRVLSVLSAIENISLILIAAIAAPVLVGWAVPGVGALLPAGWAMMKANTAVLFLLSGASFYLSLARRPGWATVTGSVLGLLVMVVGALMYGEFYGLRVRHLDMLLGHDQVRLSPSRPSVQACVGFMLMGLVLSGIRARKRALGRLIDVGTLLLGLFLMSFVGSLLQERNFSLERALKLQLAPQSFCCLALITLVIFIRRSELGAFSILTDGGIGGKTARAAAPGAVILPFVIEGMRGFILKYRLLPYNYALAVVPAMMSILAFCLVLVLARRSGQLEKATRELSLKDELTKVYNRRGFFAFAGHSLRNAIRAGEDFSILFVDVDGLKRINDELGHDLGSELLADVARLLRNTFRETDIVGRIGGDEFVVATRADAARMEVAIARLEEAAEAENVASARPYWLSFSVGCVTREETGETLEQMIDRADERMYEAKREKKMARVGGLEQVARRG